MNVCRLYRIENNVIQLIIILFIVTSTLKASQNSEYGDKSDFTINMRLDYLEKTENIRNKEFVNYKENLDNKIKNNETRQKNDYDRLVLDVRNQNTIITIFGGLFILLGVGSLLFLYSNAIKYADKKVKETLDNAFNNKAEEINKLILQQNEEYQLKTKKKILVVTPEYSCNEFLKLFFNKMGFNSDNIQYEPMLEKTPVGNFDLIIFNDESVVNKCDNNSKNEIEIEKYLQKYPLKTIRLYFGPKRLYTGNEYEKDRIITSFVNTRLQLYGNLMNALRYQDKML